MVIKKDLVKTRIWARRRTTIACLAVAATSVATLYSQIGRVNESTNANIAEAAGQLTSTNKVITPKAAPGAIFEELDPHLASVPDRRPGGAAAVAVSPIGDRLAIMTSGFSVYYDAHGSLLPEASTEFVFIYDISDKKPRQIQVLPVPNAFAGMAWAPSGHLFVSAGRDDAVIEFADAGGRMEQVRTFALGHKHCLSGKPHDVELGYCEPVAAGVAVSPDGRRVLVANIQNDSVSLIDLAPGKVVAEQDLRPGIINPARHGVPGGSFPRSVVWASAGRAYVGSVRDREIISLRIAGDRIRVRDRIAVQGQPAGLISNPSGSRLYAALDTTSQVAVYDTAKDSFVEKFNVAAPTNTYDESKVLGGANTNALALTSSGRILLASNGGLNEVAVVRLSERAIGPDHAPARNHRERRQTHDDRSEEKVRSTVVGLVPTGWYPTGIATAADGATWYVINSKSPIGPNSAWCKETKGVYCDPKTIPEVWDKNPYAGNGIAPLLANNAHVNQLEHAGLLTMPAPSPLELARLTKQVARNNRFDQPERAAADERVFSFLREHIKHVIYIMKENRSYDQVLGDLEVGNGDPRLTLFPEKISPNHHSIARNFVTLDNLLVSAEGSINGGYWTFAAQTNDLLEHTDTLTLTTFYGKKGGGFPYGINRHDDIALGTAAERRRADPDYPNDPDILPGTSNVYDVDGPDGEAGAGYIWNAALKRGLSVRDYGVFNRLFLIPAPSTVNGKAAGIQNPGQILAAYSDLSWPERDVEPDYLRVKEWRREFDEFVRRGDLPGLILMDVQNDHFGNFDRATYGVNTPETQMADNDYAVGMILEAVAGSPYAKDTIVITIEDDASDGPDHVSAQRTVTLFAGPYVLRHAVVSTRYTTVNVVKTIEEVLGIDPIGLNDALAVPMSDIFDTSQADWSYRAIVPDVLRSTQLPLPPDPQAHVANPGHSAAYWQKAMAGQDFSGPDRIDDASFNRALWRGLKGTEPYPKSSGSADDR